MREPAGRSSPGLFLACLDMSLRNVCYVLWRPDEAFLGPFMHQLSTQSPRGCCPQAHPPPPSPDTRAPLSVGKNTHTGMSLRDTAAQINRPPPLQVCTGADNVGNLCALLLVRRVKFLFWKRELEHLCSWVIPHQRAASTHSKRR